MKCFGLILSLSLICGAMMSQEYNREGVADMATSVHPVLVENRFQKIVLLDFTDVIGQEFEQGKEISMLLRDELEKRQTTYQLVAKYLQENAIRDAGYSSEDTFDEYTAAELARTLGADAVIMGVIQPGVPSEMTFIVKVLKAEDGNLEFTDGDLVYAESSVTDEMDSAVEEKEDGVIRFSLGGNKDKKRKKSRNDDTEEEEIDEFRGFSIGLNLGAYFANKKSAAFYNGACLYSIQGAAGDVRCYEIYERLTLTQQIINEIENFYNISGQGFFRTTDMYPENMRYSPGLMFGLHIKYNFNRENAIVFNSNFMRLRAVDQFTLRFPIDPSITQATENIQLFDITGEEDRFQLQLMYRMSAVMSSTSNFYFELGPGMTGVRVRSNDIFIADRSYSLLIGASNPFQIISYQPRTDIGFGYGAGAGMEWLFDGGYSMAIGINYSRDNIVLGEFKERLGNFSVMATFTL